LFSIENREIANPIGNCGIYSGGHCPPKKLHEWEMGAYAKLSKGTDTGYNLFLYGGYLQTAKNPGDSGGQAHAARRG